jgi:hypothetical protein
MSVTWWSVDGDGVRRRRERMFENCDSEGPWSFNIPLAYLAPWLRHDEHDIGKSVVVRVNETHYVVSYTTYMDQDDTDNEWLEQNYVGILDDPVYPIGPDDPVKAYTTTLTITGKFLPRPLVDRKALADKEFLQKDNEAHPDLTRLIADCSTRHHLAAARAVYDEGMARGNTRREAWNNLRKVVARKGLAWHEKDHMRYAVRRTRERTVAGLRGTRQDRDRGGRIGHTEGGWGRTIESFSTVFGTMKRGADTANL